MMSIFDPFQTGRRLSALCTGQASRRPVCLSDIVYIYYMHSIYEEHTLVKRGALFPEEIFPHIPAGRIDTSFSLYYNKTLSRPCSFSARRGTVFYL